MYVYTLMVLYNVYGFKNLMMYIQSLISKVYNLQVLILVKYLIYIQ